MGVPPMVHVRVHFGAAETAIAPAKHFEDVSLARLLYAFGVCVRTRTMGWKPMLRWGRRDRRDDAGRIRWCSIRQHAPPGGPVAEGLDFFRHRHRQRRG